MANAPINRFLKCVTVVKVKFSMRPCLVNIYRRSLQCQCFVIVKGEAVTSGFPPCERLHGFMTLQFLSNTTSLLFIFFISRQRKTKESGEEIEETI